MEETPKATAKTTRDSSSLLPITLTSSQVSPSLHLDANPRVEENNVEGYSWVTQNSPWLYPAIFAPLAYSLLRVYTRPSSQFIRKVGVVAVSAVAYQVGLRQQIKDYDLMLMNNYHAFS